MDTKKFQEEGIKLIKKYFELTGPQENCFYQLYPLYFEWNQKINLISRKDFNAFYLHHVLHSLSIAKFIRFNPGAHVLDVGTGGGFPGIPLAIYFPETTFCLIDSIGKKIKAVEDIRRKLSLDNVCTLQTRIENHHRKYDFIVSRAVTRMETFVKWTRKNIKKESFHEKPNGILYLKGGDLSEELKNFPQAQVIPLNRFFEEDFFQTKKLVYLPGNKNH